MCQKLYLAVRNLRRTGGECSSSVHKVIDQFMTWKKNHEKMILRDSTCFLTHDAFRNVNVSNNDLLH